MKKRYFYNIKENLNQSTLIVGICLVLMLAVIINNTSIINMPAPLDYVINAISQTIKIVLDLSANALTIEL